MNESTDRRASSGQVARLRPAADKPSRRWFPRSNSRLSKLIERNAQWVAEARYTPPLDADDAA